MLESFEVVKISLTKILMNYKNLMLSPQNNVNDKEKKNQINNKIENLCLKESFSNLIYANNFMYMLPELKPICHFIKNEFSDNSHSDYCVDSNNFL